jgi:ribosomal protein S12 methylthiotransferase accessory factor YcaO
LNIFTTASGRLGSISSPRSSASIAGASVYPVYFSVCTQEAEEVIGTKKQMGKGASEVQAQASACMELAERYSFFSFMNNDLHFTSGDYQQLISSAEQILPLTTFPFP